MALRAHRRQLWAEELAAATGLTAHRIAWCCHPNRCKSIVMISVPIANCGGIRKIYAPHHDLSRHWPEWPQGRPPTDQP